MLYLSNAKGLIQLNSIRFRIFFWYYSNTVSRISTGNEKSCHTIAKKTVLRTVEMTFLLCLDNIEECKYTYEQRKDKHKKKKKKFCMSRMSFMCASTIVLGIRAERGERARGNHYTNAQDGVGGWPLIFFSLSLLLSVSSSSMPTCHNFF